MARTHNPLVPHSPVFSSDNSNIAIMQSLSDAMVSSAKAFLKDQARLYESIAGQDQELLEAVEHKEILETVKHISEQTLTLRQRLSNLKQRTNALSLTENVNIGSSEDYIAQTMSAILPKLPDLIAATRMSRINEDLERYLNVMMPADPLRDVMRAIEGDNIEMQRAFVQEHECMDSKAINSMSGQSSVNPSQTASRWKRKSLIFSINYFGNDLFPAFQFEAGKPRLIIKKILAILSPHRSPWQIAYWFVDENVWLDNARPVDLMESRETDVLQAAQMEIEPSYY